MHPIAKFFWVLASIIGGVRTVRWFMQPSRPMTTGDWVVCCVCFFVIGVCVPLIIIRIRELRKGK